MLKIPAALDNCYFIMSRANEADKPEREATFSRILNASFPNEADQKVVVSALRILHRS